MISAFRSVSVRDPDRDEPWLGVPLFVTPALLGKYYVMYALCKQYHEEPHELQPYSKLESMGSQR